MVNRTRLQAVRLISLILLSAWAAGMVHATDGMADRVLVKKGERKLFLLDGDNIIRSYDIALGLMPEGHKTQEGDYKTPEGDYTLTDRLIDSSFFMAIQVSYPNAADRRTAANKGVSPGGRIMIHGQPNEPKQSPEYYARADWTNGCIAVSNAAMIEIWQLTQPNTPISIEP